MKKIKTVDQILRRLFLTLPSSVEMIGTSGSRTAATVVNCCRKELHLGWCSSPRSASESTERFDQVILKCI